VGSTDRVVYIQAKRRIVCRLWLGYARWASITIDGENKEKSGGGENIKHE